MKDILKEDEIQLDYQTPIETLPIPPHTCGAKSTEKLNGKLIILKQQMIFCFEQMFILVLLLLLYQVHLLVNQLQAVSQTNLEFAKHVFLILLSIKLL
ncbi:hypothetical protein JVU11DRAFT_10628 [Chiua virens]|nr:hypothetical protein JVU11DRAFT_10628 [Chiua virens]